MVGSMALIYMAANTTIKKTKIVLEVVRDANDHIFCELWSLTITCSDVSHNHSKSFDLNPLIIWATITHDRDWQSFPIAVKKIVLNCSYFLVNFEWSGPFFTILLWRILRSPALSFTVLFWRNLKGLAPFFTILVKRILKLEANSKIVFSVSRKKWKIQGLQF